MYVMEMSHVLCVCLLKQKMALSLVLALVSTKQSGSVTLLTVFVSLWSSAQVVLDIAATAVAKRLKISGLIRAHY